MPQCCNVPPLQVLEPAWLSAARDDRAGDRGRVKKLFAVAFLLAMIAAMGPRASSAGASVEDTTAGQSQGSGKFNHTSQRHGQIKCDACHVRRADAVAPVMPGHRACIACHIREFISKEFGICSNCHEGIKEVQPKVLTFPERQTFGTEFSHKTHATYVRARGEPIARAVTRLRERGPPSRRTANAMSAIRLPIRLRPARRWAGQTAANVTRRLETRNRLLR